MLRLAAFLILAASLAGCDTATPGPTPPPPTGDEIVNGVNLTRLFAAPSSDERMAVRSVWDARDAERPERYGYEEVARGTGGSEETLIVFEGRLVLEPGAPVAHHALVRLPPRPPGDARPIPVLFVSPRERATSAAALFTGIETSALRDDAVQILVTWRGGALDALGSTFASALPESPYDADVEDALAAQAALATSGALPFTVDFGRMAWTGRGRGGTVALLAATRTAQPDAVAAWAAPTSLFLPAVQDDVRRTLRGGDPSGLPGFDPLYRDHIFPIRGDSAALADARRALLLRSPLSFAGTLPPTLLLHSPADAVVPFAHALALDASVPEPEPLGFGLFSFSKSLEPPGHLNTFSSPPALRLAERFLAFHLGL